MLTVSNRCIFTDSVPDCAAAMALIRGPEQCSCLQTWAPLRLMIPISNRVISSPSWWALMFLPRLGTACFLLHYKTSLFFSHQRKWSGKVPARLWLLTLGGTEMRDHSAGVLLKSEVQISAESKNPGIDPSGLLGWLHWARASPGLCPEVTSESCLWPHRKGTQGQKLLENYPPQFHL